MNAAWFGGRNSQWRANDAAEEPAAPADRLVLHADFPLTSRHEMIADLIAQRQRMADVLDLAPTSQRIHLHLFSEESAYRACVAAKFPDFPPRRAIFVEADDQLAVYAVWGEHVAEDLRHETTHGYLHAAVAELPLWLDEGLAEYFETGRVAAGRHANHIGYLQGRRAGGWRPDLARLERLDSAAEMTQLDYAESWLWVHWALDSATPQRRATLQKCLSDLQEGRPAAPLSDRLGLTAEAAAQEVLQHLDELAAEPAATAPTLAARSARN